MSDQPATEVPEAPILFRRGKKRKAYRQRGDDDDAEPDATAAAATTTTSTPDDAQPDKGKSTATAAAANEDDDAPPTRTSDANHDDDDDDAGMSVAEVLRLRNARKSKARGGVPLRAESSSAEEPSSTDLVLREDHAAMAEMVTGGVGKRFASQTGLVGELVNRHMEEYIEYELARRQQQATNTTTDASTTSSPSLFAPGSSSSSSRFRQPKLPPINPPSQPAPGATALRGEAPAQPAHSGKLQEIDLGEEMRARNVSETERAQKRLRGEAIEDADVDAYGAGTAAAGANKQAGGRPTRGRKRRPSEDALRDKMVEEFLAENKMENYNMADLQEPEDERPHDDKVAENFRREFMEALHQRNRRRRPAVNQHKRPPKKDETEVLKGPKLGGSRNSRAAMRDILLKQANEKREADRRR